MQDFLTNIEGRPGVCSLIRDLMAINPEERVDANVALSMVCDESKWISDINSSSCTGTKCINCVRTKYSMRQSEVESEKYSTLLQRTKSHSTQRVFGSIQQSFVSDAEVLKKLGTMSLRQTYI